MRKSIFTLLSILIAASMILIACQTAPTPTPEPTEAPPPTAMPTPEGPPDLTGETITLYHFGDLSGPYAAITAPLIHGAEDAVEALNEAGGIYGATIEIKFAEVTSIFTGLNYNEFAPIRPRNVSDILLRASSHDDIDLSNLSGDPNIFRQAEV